MFIQQASFDVGCPTFAGAPKILHISY